jgi:hypothetical protein
LHLASIEGSALIAVIDRAVENECHGFKARMRVRTPDWASTDIEMIVHQ